MHLSDQERAFLRATAFESIAFGLAQQREMPVSALAYPAALQVEKASFVTLRHQDELLGCIGTLRPRRPLVCDVAHNAYHAAFSDPRFAPLDASQLTDLDLHISILGALERLEVHDEGELLALLRPVVDGLLIEDGARSATFLPAMWPRLPDPRTFLRALKEKAHLPPDHWSPTLRAYRYQVDEI